MFRVTKIEKRERERDREGVSKKDCERVRAGWQPLAPCSALRLPFSSVPASRTSRATVCARFYLVPFLYNRVFAVLSLVVSGVCVYVRVESKRDSLVFVLVLGGFKAQVFFRKSVNSSECYCFHFLIGFTPQETADRVSPHTTTRR